MSERSTRDAQGEIVVEARVLGFRAGVSTDYMEDGSWAVYDGTALEVLAPDELCGRTLSVFHDLPLPGDSVWRRPGARMRFRVRADLLGSGRQLFTAAAEDIEELPAGLEEHPADGTAGGGERGGSDDPAGGAGR